MQLSSVVCSESQSCSLHSQHSPAQRGSRARAARPALIRGIHRYRAFTGCGGQTSSGLMRVHLCLALKVSHHHPAWQEHWRKLACSFWNAIHSQHRICNVCWLWRHSRELGLPNGQLKDFRCNSGEVTVKTRLQRLYNGWVSKNVWLALEKNIVLLEIHLSSL